MGIDSGLHSRGYATASALMRIYLFFTIFVSLISASEIGWDKFDTNYRNQCFNGKNSFSASFLRESFRANII